MQLSNVDATLEKGRFYSGKLLIFLKFYFILLLFVSIFCPFIMLTALDSPKNIIGAICLLLGFGSGSVVFFILLRKNNRRAKDIIKFLKDARLVKVEVERDSDFQVYHGIKIRVVFVYNGTKYVRCSGQSSGKMFDGYDKVFIKYVNRTVNALYSPQYDQLIFIKDSNQIES